MGPLWWAKSAWMCVGGHGIRLGRESVPQKWSRLPLRYKKDSLEIWGKEWKLGSIFSRKRCSYPDLSPPSHTTTSANKKCGPRRSKSRSTTPRSSTWTLYRRCWRSKKSTCRREMGKWVASRTPRTANLVCRSRVKRWEAQIRVAASFSRK